MVSALKSAKSASTVILKRTCHKGGVITSVGMVQSVSQPPYVGGPRPRTTRPFARFCQYTFMRQVAFVVDATCCLVSLSDTSDGYDNALLAMGLPQALSFLKTTENWPFILPANTRRE